MLFVVLVLSLLGALAAALATMLQPPRLPVPDRGDQLFRGVTLLEPGRPPRVGWTLRISDGLIRLSVGPPNRSGRFTPQRRRAGSRTLP